MNELCSKCGKPPHYGGCKLGAPNAEEAEALARHAAVVEAKCGICLSTEHEIVDCPKATSPRATTIEIPHLPLVGQPVVALHMLDISGLHPAMADLLRECVRVQATKGSDYTEGSNDRLNNFREAAEETDEPMEKVWYVLFFKHWKAVRSWVRFGKVESEPIRGRIVDCINYLLLLWLIVREKDPKQT